MARLSLSRRWAFILALGVSLVACSVVSHVSFAESLDGGRHISDPWDSGGGPPPPAAGDPDVPVTGSKWAKTGVATRTGSHVGERTVGDGNSPKSVWMWRLRVVMQGLRIRYFGF